MFLLCNGVQVYSLTEAPVFTFLAGEPSTLALFSEESFLLDVGVCKQQNGEGKLLSFIHCKRNDGAEIRQAFRLFDKTPPALNIHSKFCFFARLPSAFRRMTCKFQTNHL